MPVWEIETPDGGLIQVEGDEEPTEDQIASFFTPEEPIQQPTIPRLQPGATLADVLRQPPLVTPPWEGGVVRSVLPGVLQPEDLLPAVRKIGGAIAEGEPGDTHPDIITREQIPAIEIDQRGFTGPEGQFLDREAAAQATGIPTMREPGRLHSTDLSAFQPPEEQGSGPIDVKAIAPWLFPKEQEPPPSLTPVTAEAVSAITPEGKKLLPGTPLPPTTAQAETGPTYPSGFPGGLAGEMTDAELEQNVQTALDQYSQQTTKVLEKSPVLSALNFTPEDIPSGEEFSQALNIPRAIGIPVSTAEKLLSGALGFFGSLSGASQAALAEIAAVKPLLFAKWSTDIAASGGEQAANFWEALKRGDMQAASDAGGSVIADILMLTGGKVPGGKRVPGLVETTAKSVVPGIASVLPKEAPPVRTLTPAIRLPDGRIFRGPAHKDIFLKVARETGEPDLLAEASKPQNQGFVNEKGEFLSRADASPIFKELTGKEPADIGSLKSEDFAGFEHLFDFGEKSKPKAEAKISLAEPAEPSIGAGIQAALMRKAEAGAIQIPQGVTDAVTKAADYVKEVASEEMNAPKMTDTRRSVLNWSAKLQKSFNEASLKQRDITRRVPKPIRREGITNWIQANGDPAVLRQRAAATMDPKLKRGYEAALNLTPDEIAVANEVKQAYADFASRGQAADVLGQLKENYVTQTWDLGKGPSGGAVGRTLKEKFRYSKASTFANFFEGEQAGYKPKTKDISKLLPMYSHEMNSVIAAREMVAQMAEGKASDGRPLLAPKGIGVPVDSGEGGKATLVMPKVGKEATADYKVLPNQPALSGWKWVSKDEAGNPIFLKADLALHPEAFDKLKNVLGRSAIRDWYGTRTTALAEIPKMLVKGIDMANSETKRTMLGLLATFHQIQTGTHAVGHRVNPLFSIPKIDLANNPLQMDAAKHGLMLAPDRASMSQFMEGFRTSGIISKIPVIGPAADWYGHYLFHDYIPGLKFKTYDAILRRNQGVYAKDLKSGKVSLEDVKILSAEQANAAYGHINYSDLSRNPTVQHVAQLGLLAPDFLEARGRFAGQAIKGIAGAKVGREQLLALATLAVAQTAGAYAISKIVDGEWDSKRPFEFTKGNRRYTLRSVPEDIQNLVTKTRQFVHNRISPLVGKGLLQYLTGIDYRGQRVKASETTKELLAQPLPLTIRGFTGLSKSTLSSMEQLAGSLGLRISRYSPQMDLADIVRDYKKGSDDPKLQAQIELQEKEVFASVYDKLRTALHSNDLEQAKKEYDKLKSIRTPKQIDNAMKPWTGGTVNQDTLEESPRKPKPFTGSLATEKKFVQSLTQDQRDIYNRAQEERIKFYRTFRDMLRQTGP